MKSLGYKLACILTLLCSFSSTATLEQVDVGAWSLGVNIGIGQRSAFITGQDDLDIYLLPNFHYYGEQFFFDNGTLGYTFQDQENFALSFIGELNPYGLYFEQSAFGESFNSLYLLDSSSINGGTTEENNQGSNLVSTDPGTPSSGNPNAPDFGPSFNNDAYSLPKPSLSLDAGIQANWFLTNNQDLTVKFVRDISNEHSGFRGKFNWAVKRQLSQVKMRLNLGFDWLDNKASNYYFGISPDDINFNSAQYQTGSSINPFIAVTANIPITRNMSFIAHLKYLKLDSAIADSPMTSQSYSVTHFAGIHYKFW